MRKRTIAFACVYALVLVLMLSALAAAQANVYLPVLRASGEQVAGDNALVSAAAGGASLGQFRGKTAYAYLYGSDECWFRYVYVAFAEEVYRAKPDGGDAFSSLTLSIDDYNLCTGTYTFLWGSSEPTDDDFTLSSPTRLASATLDTTVTVYGSYYPPYPDDPIPLEYTTDVSLTWTGTGDLSSGHSHNNYSSLPGCRWISRSRETSREAGVSGSILAGGTDYAQNTESYGYLSNVKSGSIITVGCAIPTPPPPPPPAS